MFGIFKKNDPQKALEFCKQSLGRQIDQVRPNLGSKEDLTEALLSGGVSCFLWGFIHAISSDFVKADRMKWSVALDTFEELFGSDTAARMSFAIQDGMRSGGGERWFNEGHQGGRDFLNHGVPTAGVFLAGQADPELSISELTSLFGDDE